MLLFDGHDLPIVLLDRSLPGVDCDLIVSDSIAGARRLTEHLIRIGHRQVCVEGEVLLAQQAHQSSTFA